MAYVMYDDLLGAVDLTGVDTGGPGSGRATFHNELVRGYDANLGGGEFQYAKFSGTIAAGTVVELTPSLVSGAIVMSATAWAGAVNTGKMLAVAVAAGVAGQFGWFQVQGNAIVTTAGAPVAGNAAYFSAAGSVQPTAVASKQMLNAQYATAPSVTVGSGTGATVLSATQAVVTLNRPFAQGAIT